MRAFVSCALTLAVLGSFAAVSRAAAEKAEHGKAAKVPPYDPAKAAAAAKITDPDAATQAYLEAMPAERREKTRAYAVGNYVMELVAPIYACVIAVLFLLSGLSAKMRDVALRFTRFPFLQTGVYAVQFLLLFWVATFPLSVYTSYIHEKEYGLLDKQEF